MADEIDDARRLPDRLVGKLTDAGFFRMMLDRELGGLEADPVTAAQVVETLSSVSPSVGWVVMIVASTNFWTARVLPDDAVGDIFTPCTPVNVGGNPGAPRTGSKSRRWLAGVRSLASRQRLLAG